MLFDIIAWLGYLILKKYRRENKERRDGREKEKAGLGIKGVRINKARKQEKARRKQGEVIQPLLPTSRMSWRAGSDNRLSPPGDGVCPDIPIYLISGQKY